MLSGADGERGSLSGHDRIRKCVCGCVCCTSWGEKM